MRHTMDIMLHNQPTAKLGRWCKERPNVTNIAKQNVRMSNAVELEKVGKFCYLGDMLDAESGVDLAVAARVR
jgi:hypothetical protein